MTTGMMDGPARAKLKAAIERRADVEKRVTSCERSAESGGEDVIYASKSKLDEARSLVEAAEQDRIEQFINGDTVLAQRSVREAQLAEQTVVDDVATAGAAVAAIKAQIEHGEHDARMSEGAVRDAIGAVVEKAAVELAERASARAKSNWPRRAPFWTSFPAQQEARRRAPWRSFILGIRLTASTSQRLPVPGARRSRRCALTPMRACHDRAAAFDT